jgi:hypothetical protein
LSYDGHSHEAATARPERARRRHQAKGAASLTHDGAESSYRSAGSGRPRLQPHRLPALPTSRRSQRNVRSAGGPEGPFRRCRRKPALRIVVASYARSVTWMAIIPICLVLSLGYRAWRYRQIRRSGYDVAWSVPVVRWLRRPTRRGR